MELNLIIKDKKTFKVEAVEGTKYEFDFDFDLSNIDDLSQEKQQLIGIEVFKQIYYEAFHLLLSRVELVDFLSLTKTKHYPYYDIENYCTTALEVLKNTSESLYIATVDFIEATNYYQKLNKIAVADYKILRIIHDDYDNMTLKSLRYF